MVRARWFLVALLAVGCSTGSDEPAGGGDGDGEAADAAPASSCLAPASMGPLGALAGAEAVRTNQSGSMGTRKVWRLGAFVDDQEPHDQILVELWDGHGAFADGTVTTGTFEIAGPETDIDTCGVCVYLYGDVEGGLPSQQYLAEAGTVVIDQLLPEMTGSIDGVELRELDGEGSLVADGCTSSIESASLSATVECYDGGGGDGDCTI
jgi:hypothetical protein